jgi:hypothetical protein
MTHTAPHAPTEVHARPHARGGRRAVGASPRADLHVRIPAELVAALDARLGLREFRPTRTAAITDAITRWVAWDIKRNGGSLPPNSPLIGQKTGVNSPLMPPQGQDLPPQGEDIPGIPELTYERLS